MTTHQQIIALAGLYQAAHLVDQIAKSGNCDSASFNACINSLLVVNAESTEDIYGGTGNLTLGLTKLTELLSKHSHKAHSDPLKYVLGIIYLERKLVKNKDLMQILSRRIEQACSQAEHFSPTHENVIASLASIYADTVSTYKFRIQVVGEMGHLNNPRNADKVRALLLASMRSAILWLQLNGKRWHFFTSKKRMLSISRDLLAHA